MVVFEKGRTPRKTAPEIGALPGKKPAIRQM
jgi:hypothetical protein